MALATVRRERGSEAELERLWTPSRGNEADAALPLRLLGDTERAMSQENVEIVRSMFEPFEGVNLAAIDWSAEVIREALGRAYSPDIELTTLAIPLGLDISDSYRGLDGLVEYLGAWLEPFSEYHVENLDYVDAGECVLVPSRQWGVGAKRRAGRARAHDPLRGARRSNHAGSPIRHDGRGPRAAEPRKGKKRKGEIFGALLSLGSRRSRAPKRDRGAGRRSVKSG